MKRFFINVQRISKRHCNPNNAVKSEVKETLKRGVYREYQSSESLIRIDFFFKQIDHIILLQCFIMTSLIKTKFIHELQYMYMVLSN